MYAPQIYNILCFEHGNRRSIKYVGLDFLLHRHKKRRFLCKFVLSNQSGIDISYGLDYRYTYEYEAGIWREISKRPVVFEVEYVLLHGGKQYIYADLYRNLPGQYRFFFDVWRYDRSYTFMAEFGLWDTNVVGK